MSMTRQKIEEVKRLAEQFVKDCDAAIGKLDADIEYRRKENERRKSQGWEPFYSSDPSPDDYSYGSKETGALRRKSLDLTRSLAELRK